MARLFLLVLALSTTACGEQPPTTKPADDPTRPKSGTLAARPPVRKPYALSESAARVQKMIDRRDYEAAERYFATTLDKASKDAGLLCQYARFLIRSRDPAYPNFIQTPLIRGGEFWWAQGVAGDAIKIAAGLDPECKSYVTDLVLESLAARLEEAIGEDRGFIGEGRPLFNATEGRITYYSGVSLSMIEVGFQVIPYDPERAAAWVGAYEKLTERFIGMGKVTSAMMLGNLTGDLAQGAKGAEDFKRANRAFLAALRNYRPGGGYDWVAEAAEAYPVCFRDEMLEVLDGKKVDPAFADLESALRPYRVTIPRPGREKPIQRTAPTGAGGGP